MDASARNLQLVLTCEHGGNTIPRDFAAAFRGAGAKQALASHRGWDPGALPIARHLASAFHAPLIFSTISRLLIDLNRSPGHPRLFSEFSRTLDKPTRERIRREDYDPFRAATLDTITAAVRKTPVLHLSIHSFTPVLNGVRRACDIGILYDPKRPGERAFARAWQSALGTQLPHLRIRLNYPYHGASDGHTTTLRKRFPPNRYLGIELEINQRFWRKGSTTPAWKSLVRAIEASLRSVV